MGRSYLFGILIGGLSSVLGLGVVSLMLPPGSSSGVAADNGAAAGEALAEGPVAQDAVEPAEAAGATQEPEVAAAEAAAPGTATERDAGPAVETAPENTDMAEAVARETSAGEPGATGAPAAETAIDATEILAKPTETAESGKTGTAEADDPDGIPDTPVVEVPAGSEFARARPEADMVVPAAEGAAPTAETPAVVVPEAEPAPELAEVKPAAIPDGQSEAPEVIAPPEPTEPIVLAEAPAPVDAAPQADAAAPPVLAMQAPADAILPDTTAPESPASAAEPEAPAEEMVIAQAEPGVPEAPAAAPEAPETPEIAPEAPETLDAPAAPDTQDAPAAPATAETAAEIAEAPAPAEPDAVDEGGMDSAAPDLAEMDESVPPENDTGSEPVRTTRLPQIEAPAAPAEEDAATAEAQEPEDGAGDGPVVLDLSPQAPIGAATAPQPGFAQRSGVRINRLPRIGEETPRDEVGIGESAALPAALPSAPAAEPAASRYAARYDKSDGAPFIAIVIADIGEEAGGLAPDALAAFGRPVTIAIDPARPDASERAIAYRLAGHEVAILAPDLPDGATASDLEVAYQSYATELPESVALIGAPDAAFQRDRRVAQHMVALLATEGRGLLTYDRGLNPARQAAIGVGLAHASVFRALDADGEGAATIARYLDRAAFEAARQGDVVIVASSRPETVTALQDWIAAGAKGSAVAPVSAAMTAGG